MDFYFSMLEMIEDETLISRLILNDEVSGTVSRHSMGICGTELV